jgi:hypothetical protein
MFVLRQFIVRFAQLAGFFKRPAGGGAGEAFSTESSSCAISSNAISTGALSDYSTGAVFPSERMRRQCGRPSVSVFSRRHTGPCAPSRSVTFPRSEQIADGSRLPRRFTHLDIHTTGREEKTPAFGRAKLFLFV